MYGGEERYIQSSGGEPEGKRPLGIPYGRWQNIIKMDLKVIGLESVDWSGSGQGHVAGCCKDGSDPSGSIKWGEFLGYLTNCLLQQKVCAPWCCLVSLLAGLSGCKGLRKLFLRSAETSDRCAAVRCFCACPPQRCERATLKRRAQKRYAFLMLKNSNFPLF